MIEKIKNNSTESIEQDVQSLSDQVIVKANEIEHKKSVENGESYKNAVINECDYIIGVCAVIYSRIQEDKFPNYKDSLLNLSRIDLKQQLIEDERKKFLRMVE